MYLRISRDNAGFYLADDHGMEALDKTFPTWQAAKKYMKAWQSEMARDRHDADRIDGYDRDDLGESPDY